MGVLVLVLVGVCVRVCVCVVDACVLFAKVVLVLVCVGV